MESFKVKLNNYFENTTLHGFSYISSSKTFVEKIFWLLSILGSTICCLLLFHQLIEKVENNPIIIVQHEVATHIRNIPFPAISFCASSLPFDTYETFLDPLLKFNATYPDSIKSCYNKNYCSIGEVENYNLFMFEYLWSRLQVAWMKKYEGLTNLTISQFGWCKTFNIVDDDDMFYENSTADYFKYKINNDVDYKSDLLVYTKKPPFYAIGKGVGFSGEIHMISKGYDRGCDFKSACGGGIFSVTLVIHSPYEMPDVRHNNFAMDSQTYCKLLIEPQIKITDESLLGLDVDERKCYQHDEKDLKFFKVYTAINCLKECESSFIQEKCGCVPFYFINRNMSQICSIPQLECFNREYQKFNETICKCYPPCQDVSYELAIQKLSATITLLMENPSLVMKTVARFKDDSFYAQIRRKNFTMIDWFSFIGGILGLFFGFSFLSVFEIMYHIWSGLFDGNSKNNLTIPNYGQSENYRKIMKTCEYFTEFMRCSSMHGLAYISDDKVKRHQRLAWIITFLLSISTCIFMIKQLEHKFKIDSIVIVADNNVTPISEVPFPAITIMSSTLFDDHTPFDYLDTTYIVNNTQLFDMDARQLDEILTKIAVYSQKKKFAFNFETKYDHNITNYGHKLMPLIKKYAVKINGEMYTIIWDENYSVQTAYLLTAALFGYSFNIASCQDIFNEERVSSDFLYKFERHFRGGEKSRSQKYPWYPPLRSREILDIRSNTLFPPFIYIHNSYDYPINFVREEVTTLEMNIEKTIQVLIIPETLKSSEDFLSLSLTRRMCFKNDERKLKFFKVYTQRNCMVECLSEKLYETCGCVPFDIVRENDTKICELFDYICVDKIRNTFLTEDDQDKLCNCLQTCNHISYNFEFQDINLPFPVLDGNVIFRYKENEFVAMQRVRQFTIFDFLSYIGGLLGLFAGISVLSLFEIFYFFTLRLICEVVKYVKERRRVGHEIIDVTPSNM